MATNIEIEAKALITKEEYEKLVNTYGPIKIKEFDQTNYYIESKNLDLKKLGVGLRIRKKDDGCVINLKAPLSEGLLEKQTKLTDNQFENFLDHGIFPDCSLKDFIFMIGFDPNKLSIVSQLKTHRIEVELDDGKSIFSIDKNEYNGTIDYELEMNSATLLQAKNRLQTICIQNGVEYKDNPRSKQTRCLESMENKKWVSKLIFIY